MPRFGIFQLLSIAVGLGVGVFLVGRAIVDDRWARQPLIAPFYAFDMLKSPRDADGLFRAAAFDAFEGLPEAQVRRQAQAAGLSCDPAAPGRTTFNCTYGYETDTGCCRFRLVLTTGTDGRIRRARGDKVGRCPR